jgi:peroxiredoxin
LNELRDKGLGLAAISYDSPDILGSFSRQHGITFPLLSDVGSATIKRYGILNTLAEEALGPNREDPVLKSDIQKYVSVLQPNAGMIGMAFPGTFILDRQGRITSRFFEEFYRERNTASSVLVKLGSRTYPVTGTKISSAHLDVTTYPTDVDLAPGNRFSLVLEVKPGSGIHVYAPGASGYRVISVAITPQPILRVLPIKYPPSETYFFKPLNERVPVFQRPFTLVQEVILEGTQDAQAALRGKENVTVTGTLEYQACDDKTCYNPASVPLSWTLPLRPLITARPNFPTVN